VVLIHAHRVGIKYKKPTSGRRLGGTFVTRRSGPRRNDVMLAVPPTQRAGDNAVGNAWAVACGATPGNVLVRSHQQKLAAVDPDEIGRVAL
jgi:hypothetical protein